MIRSMLSAASAVRNHQIYMDVVANNIANVNTTAFKSGRVTFRELLTQVLTPGSGPQIGVRGGVNPIQIGLGMSLGAVDTLFNQGTLQSTGRSSDLAIQGAGFFVYKGVTQNLYSRDGSLDLGLDGTLVNPATGLQVMGWRPDPTTGQIDTTQPLQTITIPLNQGLVAQQTENAWVLGNLDSSTTVGGSVTTTIQIYDSLGALHNINITFTKEADNTWSWRASTSEAGVTFEFPDTPQVVFTTAGQYDTTNNPVENFELTIQGFPNGAVPNQTIRLRLDNLTQLDQAESNISAGAQDGSGPGNLVSFSIDSDGKVVGSYSNGMYATVGQVALATFVNAGGLLRVGDNMFTTSVNSGAPEIGVAGTGSRGVIQAGYLEMSNVDLAQQFTSMIMAQRGFQANSRVISASDQMLQDLVNLVR
jgi:flagellar hook protein FlgE